MPILSLEYNGQQRSVPFTRRVTMGRAMTNDLVVDHPAISRTHAIFEHMDGAFVVTDMGSKNGIYIRDIRVVGRHTLSDGQRMVLGPATITFHTEDRTPDPEPAIARVQSNADEPVQAIDGGIIIGCECGMRLWVPREMIGGRGQCPKCKRPVELVDPNAPPRRVCSICQWEIDPAQNQQVCANCGLHFHKECWEENRGCSAYGCSQVGVLDRSQDSPTVDLPPFALEEEVGHPPSAAQNAVHHFPWEFALLGVSVICALLGLLLFGSLSILTAVFSVMYLVRQYDVARKVVLYSAIGISVVGLFAGLIASQIWWMGRTLESFLSR